MVHYEVQFIICNVSVKLVLYHELVTEIDYTLLKKGREGDTFLSIRKRQISCHDSVVRQGRLQHRIQMTVLRSCVKNSHHNVSDPRERQQSPEYYYIEHQCAVHELLPDVFRRWLNRYD